MMNREFELKYSGWLEMHKHLRNGERYRRLVEGHAHAELAFLQSVWWPAFGQFDMLHPEYEVADYSGYSRFIDFAYVHPYFRIAIEIDGYGPHVKQLSRWDFSNEKRRMRHLTLDGWLQMSFSYDEIRERPHACMKDLQQLIGRCLGETDMTFDESLDVYEKETLRLAVRLSRDIRSSDLVTYLHVERKKASHILRSLLEKGWLAASSGTKRIHTYRLVRTRFRVW
ncbi:DNA-binding response regulator [Marinicrinis lubricantis]|uniref:DNA-binding response regulator n=1 Tax=Marinicrinis lubricantis TaxID=2086470 RepID=A0ABW1IKD6_9BACL